MDQADPPARVKKNVLEGRHYGVQAEPPPVVPATHVGARLVPFESPAAPLLF